MSGIYIHIPFCKQACHYCDFHFSTSLKKKDELINALTKEIELRKDEFKNTTVETIYFGGGTPSLLTNDELQFLIDSVYKNYKVSSHPEITLEANPDDLSPKRIHDLTTTPINRLSIGVQSFFEGDLKLMNRAHNAQEAKACLEEVTKHFDNISLDLIYGIPGATNEQWLQNIETALSFNVPHISSYALTVEPKTALASFIKKGIIDNVDDEQAHEQFHLLKDKLEASGFIHYELSNFGKDGFFSKNNSAYWKGKSYVGIGPSAHSFNGKQRGWNVRNNSKYIEAIHQNKLPIEIETLTKTDQYNEYVMTGLRTIWGVSFSKVDKDFGVTFKNYLIEQSEIFINQQLLYIEGEHLRVTKKGQFLCDGIASELFKLNLS
ncbi:radical SAM family heme chaperone HemW [Winogradskyella echinorum]|uniref:Heme chaperone HemW n=1 Tax=Winogradskyella echinorum TaxID=538189 RepID=A0ABR6XZF2_9FLAO|nr:radical SAM family heme chaperone HemW [Winogradskyella echinorum]MBC3845390.1 radical SAM family heme chaperone HemW [Winogradskyella echinorum]MBC5749738.1 radical SAM family heme chaperone HemW [Winogradskyella echinorum]